MNVTAEKQHARGEARFDRRHSSIISVVRRALYSLFCRFVSHFDEGGFLEERRVGLESHVALVGEEVDAVERHAPTRRRDEFFVRGVRPGPTKGDRSTVVMR